MLIDPALLWTAGTLFSARNAAANYGALLGPGLAKFESMFAASVSGAYGKTRARGSRHLACSPTDDQAEVLISGHVAPDRILGIVAKTSEQVLVENIRLEECGVNVGELKWIVAPMLFDKAALSRTIREGRRPEEQAWHR
jgi:hypothetical protein